MKTIITANRRGGAGKTVTAWAIGAGLSGMGYRVLFVDLDSQTNLTFDLAADSSGYTSMDLFTGKVPAELIIQKKEHWDVIPATPDLDAVPMIIEGTGKEYRVKEALKPLKSQYDFCIIDTPPALNIITVNALTAATGVVMAVQPEIHSIQGIALLYDTIRQVKQYSNKDLSIYGIVITRYSGRACLSRDMRKSLETIAEQLGTKVYRTAIRECVAVKESEAKQKDIYRYAPRSNAAKDYKALLEEIMEDLKGDN